MDQPALQVPESHRDLLERALIAHVATVRASGEPMSNPMWFGWDGERIRLTHTRTREKFRNLQAEPRVALSITDPADSQRYLEVRGVVESIQQDGGGSFYRQLRQRYGVDPDAPMRDQAERVVVAIRPTVLLARSPATAEGPPAIERVTAGGHRVFRP
jgi:PPOX class probable F420-dependent enzyme